MPNNQDKGSVELCAGGEILKTTVVKDLDSIKTMLADQKESFVGIAKSIKELTEYTLRDKGHIEALQKTVGCKGKRITALEDETQEIAVDFATHLGEHKAERRLTVASGVGGAGGLLGVWELFKFLTKGP